MKTALTYILPAVLAFAVLTFCIDGVFHGITAAIAEVGRLLAGAK